MTTINSFLQKNEKTIFWIGIVVVLFSFMNQGADTQIEIPTQSVFGLFGGTSIGIGILFLGLGIVLLFSPGSPFSPFLFMIGAVLLSGGALFTQIPSLLSNPITLAIIGGALIFLYLFLK